MSRAYERKVSSEEERESYLLVEKSALGFFPSPGTPFELETPKGKRRATVASQPCTCRGPEKPHEHYFIRLETPLAKGSRARIEAPGAPGAPYRMTVRG
jgi:hypothetical protein